MKISVQWLRKWVDPPVDTSTLAAQLTLAGLEIEAVEPVAGAFDGVVVGQVVSVAPHPDAERLRVCQVNVGEAEPLQIVCGAANVYAGMFAPCARTGANLPGGIRIRRSKLRGVESHGMLCSAVELGLVATSAGLLELPADAPPGADLRTFLGLDDVTLEVNITPNRGDCLSLAGLAREVGVRNRLPVHSPVLDPLPATGTDTFPVEVRTPEDCPRYVGRVIRGVDRTRPTPLWMQERLRRSGLRSLGPLVDVTNYVMLELGQPMHAFDLNRLTGGIVVRRATPAESITLLDGASLTLDPDTLVIADQRGPLALAGIMGGEGSAISAGTTDLFLESAFFAPAAIIGRPRRYGLQTDSSYRFERGVAPNLQRAAVERATHLLRDIVGGAPGPVIEVAAAEYLPNPAAIALRPSRIQRLLGVEIESEMVVDILTRLGMTVARIPDGWQVTPPDFRFDISLEVDLIEELARVRGYEHIPHTRPAIATAMGPRPENTVDPAKAARFLVARDYQEVITYSFVDPTLRFSLDPQRAPLPLANPLSTDLAVMRTSLWPGLVQAARYNFHRQQERVRLFEIGRTFVSNPASPPGTDLRQAVHIAGLALGAAYPEQWGEPRRTVDFFDIKGDLEALVADQVGAGVGLRYEPRVHPSLHPGQSAALMRDEQQVGWIGTLHPALGKHLDLGVSSAVVFELDLEALKAGGGAVFQPLSKFPAIRRDLAILVGEGVSVEALLRCVRTTAGTLLQGLVPFDIYAGKGIEPGRKSVAMGLTLQDPSRTLKDSEVDAVVASVVQRLASEFDATLRE
ncbi:phenylalanine--tRNA ligase subunit beta [Gammaproteobacteria bacterium]